MKHRLLFHLLLAGILAQCFAISVLRIVEGVRFRRLQTAREQRLVEDVAARFDAVQEALIPAMSILQYRPEVRTLVRSGDGIPDEALCAATARCLADLATVHPAVVDAALILPNRQLVVGTSGVESVAVALRRDPDTYRFLESWRPGQHAWVPQHRAFVRGQGSDVLVLAVPMTTERKESPGIVLAYLSTGCLQTTLLQRAAETDYLFVLDEDRDLLLASADRHFLATTIIPTVLARMTERVSIVAREGAARAIVRVRSARSRWTYVGVFTLPGLERSRIGWVMLLVLIPLNVAAVLALKRLAAGGHALSDSRADTPPLVTSIPAVQRFSDEAPPADRAVAPLRAERSPPQHAALDVVIAFIHLNYPRPLHLSDLASVAGVSPQYFCTIFRLHTGRTVVRYTTEIRIEAARRLLAETCDPVAVIAARVGFSSSQYFCRIFRRLTALSPLEYRRTEQHARSAPAGASR